MRINEFVTDIRNDIGGKRLYAWARYKRGNVPDPGEFAYIDKRAKSKYPTAELVKMHRRFVPRVKDGHVVEPTEVWWEFVWWIDTRQTK